MSIRTWLIKKLGGQERPHSFGDLTSDEVEIMRRFVEQMEEVRSLSSDEPVSSSAEIGKVEFIGDPTAEEEENALEEINTPKWKKFLEGFVWNKKKE